MTTQSAHSGSAAHPVRPVAPGQSSRAMAGRHSAAPGAELAAALRSGTGHERCYDLFAPQLYRYCWSLLGPGGSGAEPDRAAAAVYETYLAAAHSIGALRDDREFAAWLYALARTAARRRGFTPRSPYAQLPTAAVEQAVVQLSLRLPPSHRELLELYLRHGLPTGRIARVLGLSDDTAAELCRTGVLRSAELLARYSLAPERTGGHGPDRGVRAVLAELEPPGPPPALRERVVEGCGSTLAAEDRRAAAEALAPLGEDGFPLHRNRAPATRAADGDDPGGAANAGRAGSDLADAAALPRDRVTTRDVPPRSDPEPVAELRGADAPGSTGRTRRRWLTPVTAVVAAAAVVASLWGAVAAVRAGADDTVTGSQVPAPPTAAPSVEGSPGAAARPADAGGSGDTDQVRPEPLVDATATQPSAPADGASPAPGQQDSSQAPEPGAADGAADDSSAAAQAPGGQGGQGQQGSQSGNGSGEQRDGGSAGGGSAEGAEGAGGSGGSDADSGSGGSGQGGGDGSEDDGGPVSDLLGGLLGLLGAGG
ncbi:RNA polymerase sigma factor [Streptomonospora litoralis]|uniref:Uncharacterized protein n=1 Tax=Streptomonospora litoralis TaxID=2498135 RepID=A0A4P6PXV4_9ACTN|nr:sigma-70 family RNA polymerase sigma factor [Streptomonospora litoralis]QBI52923.1 hypothetical protein EKD16_05600 [Streptomonospora litoralis]